MKKWRENLDITKTSQARPLPLCFKNISVISATSRKSVALQAQEDACIPTTKQEITDEKGKMNIKIKSGGKAKIEESVSWSITFVR